MSKANRAIPQRIDLGRVSRSTRGGVRGTIEAFGLYTPDSRIF
jgi:hypothetical protein